MKILIFFDAYASISEIKGEIASLSNLDGVTSSTVFQRAAGDELGAYSIAVEVDAARAEEVMGRIKSFASGYSGYVSNLKIAAYRPA